MVVVDEQAFYAFLLALLYFDVNFIEELIEAKASRL